MLSAKGPLVVWHHESEMPYLDVRLWLSDGAHTQHTEGQRINPQHLRVKVLR